MAIAMGRLGMSLSDFYELTPVEFRAINEQWNEAQANHLHLMQVAVYAGFGQANGGKKFKSVFKHMKNTVQVRKTPEEMEAEFREITEKLKGGRHV